MSRSIARLLAATLLAGVSWSAQAATLDAVTIDTTAPVIGPANGDFELDGGFLSNFSFIPVMTSSGMASLVGNPATSPLTFTLGSLSGGGTLLAGTLHDEARDTTTVTALFALDPALDPATSLAGEYPGGFVVMTFEGSAPLDPAGANSGTVIIEGASLAPIPLPAGVVLLASALALGAATRHRWRPAQG